MNEQPKLFEMFTEEVKEYLEDNIVNEDEFKNWYKYWNYCNDLDEASTIDVDNFIEAQTNCNTMEELAEELAEQMGWYSEMEKLGMSARYFDLDTFANDLRHDYFELDGKIYRSDIG